MDRGLFTLALPALYLKFNRKENQQWHIQLTEAQNDRTSIGGDWLSLNVKARLLLIAVISVAVLFATPALANCPKPTYIPVARTPLAAKAYAKAEMKHYGWSSKAQWKALDELWTNESNWRPNAYDHTPVRMIVNGEWIKVYAGGICQKLGLSPKDSVEKQVKVGLDYIKARYGSPSQALRFWRSHYWY